MKKLLRNLGMFCLAMTVFVSVGRAQGPLVAIEYRNMTIPQGGQSFSMEVWAKAESGYAAAALPWASFVIRLDLTLSSANQQAVEIGDPIISAAGLATSSTATNNPAGGLAPKLGLNLGRGTGGDLTTTFQRLATINVPITAGIVTSASVASTRPSTQPTPLATESFWTSSVASTTRRPLITPTTDTPLPVKLASFKAYKEGSSVAQLSWTTTEEVNSSRFDIERSADSKAWEIIGTIASNGNSNAMNSYNFTDATPLKGANYYRLKMVDLDETFANSSIQSLNFGEFSDRAISVYPNPVSDVLYLNDANLASVKQIALLTSDGVTAFQANSVNADGINVKNLTGGLYVVKLTHQDGSSSNHRVLITR